MRLLIATPLYPPDPGGPATYAKALEEGLPPLPIEVDLVKFSDVRHLPKGVRHVAYFWRVLRALKGVDVVLALDPVSVGLPALLAALIARKKFVLKVVGDYAWEQGRQRWGMWLSLDEFVHTSHIPPLVYALRRIQTFVASRAAAVIVPSQYLKGIVMVWGIPDEKITVIPNAEPRSLAGKLPESVASTAHPRIVTSGRLVPWKGMHGVIVAMLGIRQSFSTAELIIIGDGPDRATLERYATARLGTGFQFTGALPNTEALAVMQSADVLVLNSTYEGLSHILLEGLSLGKAIVATAVGGNPEVIQHDENGILVPAGAPEELASACVRILKDPALRTLLETNAKKSSARYRPELMVNATAALLTSLI